MKLWSPAQIGTIDRGPKSVKATAWVNVMDQIDIRRDIRAV
jgi:hypothetical protein